MGAGAAKRFSAVRWGVAGNIVFAWMLTLPAAAALGAFVYAVTTLFGSGVAGPIAVTLALLALLVVTFARRAQRPTPAPIAP